MQMIRRSRSLPTTTWEQRALYVDASLGFQAYCRRLLSYEGTCLPGLLIFRTPSPVCPFLPILSVPLHRILCSSYRDHLRESVCVCVYRCMREKTGDHDVTNTRHTGMRNSYGDYESKDIARRSTAGRNATRIVSKGPDQTMP